MILLIFFVNLINATHFRAIGYSIAKGKNSMMKVSRTQAWRRDNSGYLAGCTDEHIANQTVATVSKNSEICTLQKNGEECGTSVPSYIVTDLEEQNQKSNSYCYGYKQDIVPKPSGPYTITWAGCCWVDFTSDSNIVTSLQPYGFIATVNDVNNNTPQVKLPPLWKIMLGCPGQTLELNPIDVDKDTIRCRFATAGEAMGAEHTSSYASLSINQESCILTYDGTMDFSDGGVKPIALMVEDFDKNGNVRSSMPIQFLATVWKPLTRNFFKRQLAYHVSGRPVQYKPFFGIDLDDEYDDDLERYRRQINLPKYCLQKPMLIEPTPLAGSVITVPVNGYVVELKAISNNGGITRFQFNSPMGMTCLDIDQTGYVKCTWIPAADQYGQTHNFCFIADDSAGLSSERRCISLNVGSRLLNDAEHSGNDTDETTIDFTSTTSWPTISSTTLTTMVFMEFHVTDFIADSLPWLAKEQLNNYGCAGRDFMNSTAATLGKPVDDLDKALNIRKHCIKCANKFFDTVYQSYSWDRKNKICADFINDGRRAYCECDRNFIETSQFLKLDSIYIDYDPDKCEQMIPRGGQGQCCRNSRGMFSRYNEKYAACCSGSVVSIGTC